ncbi:MAG: hypothetical protein NZ580_04890 [Bacteroidia bacterium]|nr:hypothetical protein [Bacteroidia bacterium]MDW8236105.1 hypothetical protein [Bacteroidia bacterium]
MSLEGFGLLLLWTAGIAIWLVRLSLKELYPPQTWVSLWLSSRVLLRFFLGLGGILWWEAERRPSDIPFHVIVLDGRCPTAWKDAQSIGTFLLQKGARVGVAAALPGQAFWVVFPTRDSGAFSALMEAAQQAVSPREIATLPYASGLSLLRPWRNQIHQVVWMGRFAKEPVRLGEAPPLVHPGCSPLPQHFFSELDLPFTEKQGWQLLFFLSGLGLLGGEIALYIIRKYLPF